jgi:hypothetical protein
VDRLFQLGVLRKLRVSRADHDSSKRFEPTTSKHPHGSSVSASHPSTALGLTVPLGRRGGGKGCENFAVSFSFVARVARRGETHTTATRAGATLGPGAALTPETTPSKDSSVSFPTLVPSKFSNLPKTLPHAQVGRGRGQRGTAAEIGTPEIVLAAKITRLAFFPFEPFVLHLLLGAGNPAWQGHLHRRVLLPEARDDGGGSGSGVGRHF